MLPSRLIFFLGLNSARLLFFSVFQFLFSDTIITKKKKRLGISLYYNSSANLQVFFFFFATMGGDGQALANKRSLLQKSRVYVTAAELEGTNAGEKQTAKSRSEERWRHCALSLSPLELPAAFDAKGNVYSKQSVVDYLLRRKEAAAGGELSEAATVHLKKLNDVREVSNDAEDSGTICCPVTGFTTSSGVHAFVGFWGCGHVVCASTVPRWTDLNSQIDVDCPVCGVQSFYVRLVLDSEADAETQLTFLRSHLKKHRKRAREE